jgi:hypothetical protein
MVKPSGFRKNSIRNLPAEIILRGKKSFSPIIVNLGALVKGKVYGESNSNFPP